MRQRLKILLTNVQLNQYTGTEIVVRDLALGFQRLGHEPIVYTPRPDGVFDDLVHAGIHGITNLSELSIRPDIIHGHHHVETVQACDRFPNVPAIFVVHDRRAFHDIPPEHPQIQHYVAVDYNCLERLANVRRPVRVIPNAVDVQRYLPRSPLPQQPKRALIFSNYAKPGNDLETIRTACTKMGIQLDVIGAGVENLSRQPEEIIGQYDIVFAKGRAAIEAMAVGAAVILYDFTGLGGIVHSTTVQEIRRWNLGMRLLNRPITVAGIVAEIERYNPEDAQIVSDYIRTHASLDEALQRYLQLYRTVMINPTPDSTDITNPPNVYPQPYRTLERVLRMVQQHELDQRTARLEQMVSLPLHIEPDQIQLILEAVPQQTEEGKHFPVRIHIDNRSPYMLGEFPPYPIHLSYYWLSEEGIRLSEEEPPRTSFQAPIQAHGQRSLFMQITAPERPGSYQLRVTLVQEWCRWFDEDPLCIYAESIVEVLPTQK